MRKLTLCLAGVITLLSSCSDSNEALLKGGDINVGILPEEKPNEVVEQSLFDKLNLDYPGLEKVKEYHEAGQDYYACYELLQYYRNRFTVVNPEVDLINTKVSESELNIADQALEHRFYVKNNYVGKDPETGLEIYHLFEDKDGNIDWELTVEGTDQEFVSQRHRHQWMEPQAKAYRVTKDEKYVQSWIEVYSDWLETYPIPATPEETDFRWDYLQAAERILSQLNIMYYTINSVNFTPEWLSKFLNTLERHVFLTMGKYYSEGNILIAQAQAIATAGILLPEFKEADKWVNEGMSILLREMNKQFLADGVQYELDMSYHMGVVGDYLRILELAQANNKMDLLPADYVSSLYKSCSFLKDIIYPDYSWECFNDTRETTKSVLTRNLREYSALFPEDGGLKWMATEGKSGQTPDYLTKSYPDAGYHILRDGWSKESTMLILKNNNNPQNKWHCQPDNGTIAIYKNGRKFFPDAGVFAYSGDERNEYRKTWKHNTLTQKEATIDGSHQNGKLVKMETLSDNTDVLITENESYEGLTHRRTVFFVQKKFFVLVDEAFGETERTQGDPSVELNFHLLSDAENPTVVDKFDNSTDEGELKPYQKVWMGGAHTNFTDGNNICIRSFAEATKRTQETDFKFVEKTTDYSVEHNKVFGKRVGYQMGINRRNQAMRFITVIYPCANYSDITSMNAKFTDNGDNDSQLGVFKPNGASLSVEINGETYPLSYTVE